MVDRNGNVVNYYQYDEWGNILVSNETVSNPFKYAGEVYDQETGLYYLRARYYDPSIGRFLNEDSYEGQVYNPLTLNLYTYCINNPINRIDPSGHDSYVFYGLPHGEEGGFYKQAQSEAQRLEELYATTVHVIPIETEEEFINAWKGMGYDSDGNAISIEGVSLLFHSNPHNLLLDYTTEEYITTYSNGHTQGTEDSAEAFYIGALESKTFDILTILGCNSGHLDHQDDNLAVSFLINNNISEVSAWDGSLKYAGSWFYFWGSYHPVLAWSQHYFHSWGTKKRSPWGEVIYKYDSKGNIIVTPRIPDSYQF